MRSKSRRLRASVAFLIWCAVAVSAVLPAEYTSGAGAPAPRFELKNLEGKPVKLADFQGKVVLLNFWATWCVPCRQEIPGFVALQQQYGDKGLVIIGVSLDEQGVDVVKKFAKQFEVTYPVVMGNEKLIADYGNIEAVPTTFVIDREGRIAGRHVGFADKAIFEEAIKPLL